MRDLKTYLTNFVLIILSVFITLSICFAAGEADYHVKVVGLSIDPPVEWFEFHKDRGWPLVPGRYHYFHCPS